MYLSLNLLNFVSTTARVQYGKRHLQLAGTLMPLPGALLVAAASVLVSRGLNVSPALLFGLVVGVTFAKERAHEEHGRLALVATASILGLGLGSWLTLSIMVAVSGRSESFLGGTLEDVLAATALECLSVLLVGLLPFTYLEGKALHDWNKRVWAAAYFVAAGAFVFIAVPLGGDWESSREPLTTWLLIIGGFGLISMAAWSVFRFLPQHVEEREHATQR